MDLRTFVGIMLRSWWLIALSVLTTAGSAAYVVRQQESIYRAETVVELKPNTELEPAQSISAWNVIDKRSVINTTARKAEGSAMQELVAKDLNLPVSYIAETDLSAIVVPESNLIEIRAISTKPEVAAMITNKVAEELSKQPEKVFQIEVTDIALPPTSPISPQPTRTITLGVLFGLALGVAFALLGYFIQMWRATGDAQAVAADESLAVDSSKTRPLVTR